LKQGIIFDMDGTLWDAAANVAVSWELALQQCGYPNVHVTEGDMYRLMGKTMDVIAADLFPFVEGAERDKLLQVCCQVENDYLRQHGGTLYPELRATMERLKEQYHLYIVSNCQAGYIEAFLDYYQFHDLFEDMECFGNNGLPKAGNIRQIVERNHLQQAVYVGDIQGDFEATTEAGLPFIHAAYGFGTISEPTPKISALAELPEVVAQVLC
jgi:phosphoglycolate phosphatase